MTRKRTRWNLADLIAALVVWLMTPRDCTSERDLTIPKGAPKKVARNRQENS